MARGMKLGLKQELILSGVMVTAAVAAWYMLLYQPIAAKTTELKQLVGNQQDSLQAIKNYETQTAALRLKIQDLQTQTKIWDSRFPARREIVALAGQILQFGKENGLTLIEMKPSLFELYALEKAGAQMSGKYVMQLPITCHFKGRYLALGRMLEKIDALPFNLTIEDVNLAVIPDDYPELDVKVRLFLYVHL